MGFLIGFLLGLLVIPLSILGGLYYFFNYSKSYEEERKFQEEVEQANERARDLEPDEAAAFYAYRRQHGFYGGGAGHGGGAGPNIPEHLDPQYQFAGWVSIRRTPEVDHRVIEPSLKKESKKHKEKNGHGNSSRKGTTDSGNSMDRLQGMDVEGSWGTRAAEGDPRFPYLDTNNLHLTLPPYLQARFKDSRYIVIKGTTMFIYENELMQECLGIITIPNYLVSVPGELKDSHVYSKRHPIWLQYKGSAHDRRPTGGSDGAVGLPTSTKDYYLSMVACVEKEDLYFTLIRCSKLKLHSNSTVREIPRRDSTMYDKSAMDTLIRTIHSNEHQFQAAWLNALIGRIYLGIYKTPQIKELVLERLTDKLSRVRMPAFITDLRMRSVHLGDGVPFITKPKLLTLKPNGDMIMDMNFLYQGGFQAEMKAEAVVTMRGMPAIKVSLVLTLKVLRLEGRLQAWIKPPPSNRLWYGFYSRPKVDMKIETAVSDKAIRSTLILKAIENKLLEALDETMVLPNMDDIPFSETNGMGGIFGEEIAIGGQQQQQQQQTDASSLRKMSNTPRSNTINVAADLPPRRAMDLGSQPLDHSTSLPTGSTSKGGDEIMQTNYVNEISQGHGGSHMTAGIGDLDPMKIQSADQQFTSAIPPPQRPTSTHPSTVNGNNVPRTGYATGQEPNDPLLVSSIATNEPVASTKHSPGNRLLNRFGHKNNGGVQQHNRKTSWDPVANNASSPATSSGFSSSPASRYAQLSVSTDNLGAMFITEEPRSMFNLPEYEPPRPNESKEAKKRMKERQKELEREEKQQRERAKQAAATLDGDQASVVSKDSGDSSSSRWTMEGSSTQGSSMLMGASVSTYASSTKSEKFSFSRLFGFRKKNNYTSSKTSSIQTPFPLGNNSSDALSVHSQQQHHYMSQSDFEDPQDMDPMLTDEEYILQQQQRMQNQTGNTNASLLDPERQSQDGGTSSRDGRHKRLSVQQLPTLSESFQVEQRHKFESSPDLTSPRDGNSAVTFTAEQRRQQPLPTSSPAGSIYAPSLFGSDDYSPETLPGSRSKSPAPSQQQQQQDPRAMLNSFSPKFAPSLRNLRNRSRGNSATSRTELSIPADIGLLAQNKQLQLLQQQQQSNSASDAAATSGGSPLVSASSSHTSISKQGAEQSDSSFSKLPVPTISTQQPLPHLREESREDEQFPRGAHEPYVPVSPISPETVYSASVRAVDGGGSAADNSNRSSIPATPTIVLQTASPYLQQSNPASPVHPFTTNDGGLSPHSQGRQTLHHQRSAGGLNSRYVEQQGDAARTRPRRHSINHLPRPSSTVQLPAATNGTPMASFPGHLHDPPPSSPLRNEYVRDATTGEIVSDDKSSASSSSTAGSSSSNSNKNGSVRSVRSRNKSESFSQTGMSHITAAQREYDLQIHSIQHAVIQPSQQQQHGGLRHFFANLGSKSKRKGSVSSSPTPSVSSSSSTQSSMSQVPPTRHGATTADDGTYHSSPPPVLSLLNGGSATDDSAHGANMVAMVGVMAMRRTSLVAVSQPQESAVTTAPSQQECCESLSSSPLPPQEPANQPTLTHLNRQESTSTSSCEAMAVATGVGLHTCAMIRTNTWSDSSEAIHPRPGWVGEFPTPVRMHSSLNREGARVRAQVELEDGIEAVGHSIHDKGSSNANTNGSADASGRLSQKSSQESLRGRAMLDLYQHVARTTFAETQLQPSNDLMPPEPPKYQISLAQGDLSNGGGGSSSQYSTHSLPLPPKQQHLPEPVTRPLNEQQLPLAIPVSARTANAVATSPSSTVSSIETWSTTTSSTVTEPTPRLSSSSSSTTSTMMRMDYEHLEFMQRLGKLDLMATHITDMPNKEAGADNDISGASTRNADVLSASPFPVGEQDPCDQGGSRPAAQENSQEDHLADGLMTPVSTTYNHLNNLGTSPSSEVDLSPSSAAAGDAVSSPPPTPVKKSKRGLLQRLIRRKSVDGSSTTDGSSNGSTSPRATSLRSSPSLVLNGDGQPMVGYLQGRNGSSVSLVHIPTSASTTSSIASATMLSPSFSSHPYQEELGSPILAQSASTSAPNTYVGGSGSNRASQESVPTSPSTPTKTHHHHHHLLHLPRIFPAGHAPVAGSTTLSGSGSSGGRTRPRSSTIGALSTR